MTRAFYYAKEVDYGIPVASNLPPMPYMRFAYTFAVEIFTPKRF